MPFEFWSNTRNLNTPHTYIPFLDNFDASVQDWTEHGRLMGSHTLQAKETKTTQFHRITESQNNCDKKI